MFSSEKTNCETAKMKLYFPVCTGFLTGLIVCIYSKQSNLAHKYTESRLKFGQVVLKSVFICSDKVSPKARKKCIETIGAYYS